LCDSGWITHLRGQLNLFSFGGFIERLAQQFTVIRYDKPGCGLSDRDVIDLSFDGQVAAAIAVADAVGARRFRLFGASQGGQLAAAIAARYPERVEALVVYGMCASGRDLAPVEVRKSVVALVRAHWGMGLQALTSAFATDPTAEDVAAAPTTTAAMAKDRPACSLSAWIIRRSASARAASNGLLTRISMDTPPEAGRPIERTSSAQEKSLHQGHARAAPPSQVRRPERTPPRPTRGCRGPWCCR
jgi:pimeloyl-ACP methyl ester carboxylesterase